MEKRDQELYNDFLNGSEKAFEKIMIKYKDNIVYFISKYVKNLEAAEDIFQDVMLYILEHKKSYNSKYSLKTYLYMIAKSKAIDYIRHEKKIESTDEIENLPDINLLEEKILSKEKLQRIKDVINKLPFNYQMVIYFTKIEKLSYKDTAIIMKKSEKQIKTLAYNAKKKLRKVLIEERIIEMKNNKMIKILSIIILTIFLTSGFVFAGVTIYNKFIKQRDEIDSRGLFDLGDGISISETDLMLNDMIWNKDCKLYHKIITNIEDYNKYKSRVKELPDMTEKDFNKNFLVIIANENERQLNEKDLEIFNIEVDETTVHIIMKQKENPNFENDSNIWYAIIDKSQLRDNADVKIKQEDISSEQFEKIENLTEDYDNKQAISDGCIVSKDNEIISDNLEILDNFIENKDKNFIRIFEETANMIRVKDVSFKNGVYYVHSHIIKDLIGVGKTDYYYSYPDIEKTENNNKITYYLRDKNSSRRGIELLIVQK